MSHAPSPWFSACKSFMEKRLTYTEAVIAGAHEQKSIFESELRDGEARLLQLQSEFEARPEPVGLSVAEMQRKIDQLAQERRCVEGQFKATPTSLDDRWSSTRSERSSTDAWRPSGLGRVVELPKL